jgi:sonic hedgehog protein
VAADGLDEYCLSTSFKPIYAGSVTAGQRVLVQGNKGGDSSTGDAFHVEVVVAVSMSSLRGTYAPLTAAGTLVVDNVVASCYADIDSHCVAHAAFLPLRWACQVQEMFCRAATAVSWSSSSRTTSANIADKLRGKKKRERAAERALPVGLHWYPAALISVAQWILPGHLSLQIRGKEKGKRNKRA